MNKIIQLVGLIPLLPLIGFIINGLGRKYMSKSVISVVGCGVLLASFVMSVLIFSKLRMGTPKL